MKLLTITALSAVVISLLFSSGFAAGDDDVEKGKALFNDPKLSGSSFGVSCNVCHPDGKGLEKSFNDSKKKWKSWPGGVKSLEDAINNCIVMANKGHAIGPKSQNMKDLVEYIRSLGKKPKMQR